MPINSDFTKKNIYIQQPFQAGMERICDPKIRTVVVRTRLVLIIFFCSVQNFYYYLYIFIQKIPCNFQTK